MTIDYERLEGFIERFTWEDRRNGAYQLVWSSCRNRIDADFYLDCVLRNCGNEVVIEDPVLSGRFLAITIGGWLYLGDKDDVLRRSDTVLLYRVKWDNVVLLGPDGENEEVSKITIRRRSFEK